MKKPTIADYGITDDDIAKAQSAKKWLVIITPDSDPTIRANRQLLRSQIFIVFDLARLPISASFQARDG